MALHEVQVVKNNSTDEHFADTPYRFQYVSKGTKEVGEFCELVSKHCGLPPIECHSMIDGVFGVVVTNQVENPVRWNLGFGSVFPVIKGTFETVQGEWDRTKNEYIVVLALEPTLRRTLANVRPNIVSNEYAAKVMLSTVMWGEEDEDEIFRAMRPYDVLFQGKQARLGGTNIGYADAEVFVVNASTGVKTTLTRTIKSKSAIQLAAIPTTLAVGDYTLHVRTTGGLDGGMTREVKRRVQVATPAA